MKLNFPFWPKCENCKTRNAIGFLPVGSLTFGKNPEWTWVCSSDDCPDGYLVEFSRFFHSPASTVDWIAHLSEKPRFNSKAFCEMMVRFREETKCFNQV